MGADWRIAPRSDFRQQLGTAFTLQGSNRTTICCIRVNTDHFSFKQSKQESEICLDTLLTRPRTYLYQLEAVRKSRPETIFTRCYSFMPYTTRRKRVVVNAKRHWDLFQCADYHARAIKHACSCSWQLTLYRPMTPYGVMRLMFPYDQWRRTASWVLTCLWVFPPEDSGLARTVHASNSIHYTHRKLIVHILIETSTLTRRKLNVA